MEEIKIEKNVPLPTREWTEKKYPFDKMEIGDSFSAGEYTNVLAIGVRGSAQWYVNKTKSDKKFSVKKCDGKVRCWRIQ